MLSPSGWLYGKIADLRNALYDKGVFKSFSLGVKTISVGNITVGGTGKTPLVAFIAEILAEQGENVCILTRGYGRENPKQRVLVSDSEMILANAKKAGDEPLELAVKLLGKAIVIADADRVSAAKFAKEKFGVTAFMLDDGFQHRRVNRDLDIVCIDATNPFGNGKMLPAGILREPLNNLKRADAIVITRANLSKNIENLKSEISEFNRGCPIFTAKNSLSELVELEEFHAKTSSTPKRTGINVKALAFCGLGNPNIFFELLRREGIDLAHTETFRDHHFYRQSDIDSLEKRAGKSGAEILLTTAKDGVKLKHLSFKMPCFVVETEMKFDDEKGFRGMIQRFLSGGPFLSPQ